MAIGNFLKRNLVSITFPTLAIAAIYFDWSHTQEWKKRQQN